MNKKLLALFLACFLPVALLAGSGDVNGDGKIDEKDIKLIAEYIMGKSPENFNKDEADVNGEAYKVAQARSRTRGAEAQPKRRIESRPPTIYKGTWRDAGKCEKVDIFTK